MFLRELLQTCLAYLAVGITFGLWGIPYAIAQAYYGWTSWALLMFALGGGFTTSLLVWRRIGPPDSSSSLPLVSPAASSSTDRLRQHR